MWGLVLSLFRLPLIPSVCLLMLSIHSLWAQRSSPVGEISVQRFSIPAQIIGSEAQAHLHFIAFSRDFRQKSSSFLCTADCMAEGEEFEPSVRFVRRKLRRSRNLR